MKKEKEIKLNFNKNEEMLMIAIVGLVQDQQRLKIAIWALVIFQVIFVPCVIIAINSLWGAII